MIVFPSKVFDKGINFTSHYQSNINFEFFCSVDENTYFLEKSEMRFLLILMVFGFGLVQSRLLMADYLLQTATKKCTIDRLLELKNT